MINASARAVTRGASRRSALPAAGYISNNPRVKFAVGHHFPALTNSRLQVPAVLRREPATYRLDPYSAENKFPRRIHPHPVGGVLNAATFLAFFAVVNDDRFPLLRRRFVFHAQSIAEVLYVVKG